MKSPFIHILGFILLIPFLMSGQGQGPFETKEQIDRLNSLIIRSQPLYLLTHNTLMLEADYSFNEKIGLGLDYYYSFEIPEGNEICFRCFLTEFAENRHLVGLSFRVNIWNTSGLGLYISPYTRLRIWKGDIEDYAIIAESSYNAVELESNGLAVGGIIGFKESFGKRFDYNFFMGYGRYIAESYDLPEGYSPNFIFSTIGV